MSKVEGSIEAMKVMKETALSEIFVNTRDERVRNVLKEIKASKTFEENTKAITNVLAANLKVTLFFLRGLEEGTNNSEINGHRQPGLVRCVLLEVQNLLPFKCNSCCNMVLNKRLDNPEVRCRGCGIGACLDCFTDDKAGWSFLCSPCGTTVDNKRKTPEHLLTLHARKARKNTAPQTIEDDVEIEDLGLDETDDEISEIPLGQRTPPFQSTQAEVSEAASGGFPELNFTSILSSQGGASGSGGVSGPEAGSAETSANQTESLNTQGVAPGTGGASGSESSPAGSSATTENDFIEPPKRVRSDNKKQKKAKSALSQVLAVPEGESSTTSTTCRFFMRGNCKFGFYGKGKAGQGGCPFSHPKPCRKLMDNGAGEGGCSKGRECVAAHPRMCHQSLTSRTCSNIKDGARCSSGYHVRGTKALGSKPLGSTNSSSKGAKDSKEKVDHNRKKKDPNQTWSSLSSPPSQDQLPAPTTSTPSLGEQQLALSSVFGEIIRAEVIKLLQTGTLWPQRGSQQGGPAVTPPVSPPVLKGQDTTITMGSLGALLSLMGNHQQ
jgi:hypothetical protein